MDSNANVKYRLSDPILLDWFQQDDEAFKKNLKVLLNRVAWLLRNMVVGN